MAISSVSPATAHPPPPPPGNAQQVAQLNQLVSKYKVDITRDADTQVLSSLARQIAVVSTAAGQHVTLPSGGREAATPANEKAEGGLNVTA